MKGDYCFPIIDVTSSGSIPFIDEAKLQFKIFLIEKEKVFLSFVGDNA